LKSFLYPALFKKIHNRNIFCFGHAQKWIQLLMADQTGGLKALEIFSVPCTVKKKIHNINVFCFGHAQKRVQLLMAVQTGSTGRCGLGSQQNYYCFILSEF
jgi:hypothetical protein